ncbi:unnamed protein product [Aureobasidium pullulans]|nr:unnamed protein product [Aureobasidium pullulans]
MSAKSPARQSRRAAASRRRVVDSDDDMEMDMGDDVSQGNASEAAHEDEQEEAEYTPAPARSRRHTKSAMSDTPATPQTASRTRHDHVADGSVMEEATSPTKPKRRSAKTARTVRKSRISTSVAPETEASILPTSQQSASPASQRLKHAAPLSDITETAVNDQTPRAQTRPPSSQVQKVDINTTTLEKPMDIVVRTRAAATMPGSQAPSEPRSRTVITHLVLKNFKSYAGRQEVGPFHASFSSVVGPNGSGKSNVIDSLLFVFGFRASKMRQGKISALIHNSAAYPDLDHCEVEVHFQQVMDLPAGGHEVIADSQLIISRRAFKNNASKYYINSRESNFTAVTTLLRDRGVDLDHKRFLILQGEVESIAQMKPKAASEHDDGLLEYLEDIIGTSKYKTPIDEAAAETEALNEVCAEKNTRVQHLATKQSALYQIYTNECTDNVTVTQEAGNQEDIKRLQKQHNTTSKEYERMSESTQSILKEMAKLDKDTSELEILRERGNAGANAVQDIGNKIASFYETREAKVVEYKECKRERKAVEGSVQEAQAEVNHLVSQEPALRNVLTGLMRLKESGRIDGFHGRLGNLGAIDARFDVAISTACPSLDNLVVDSVEVGQQCIEYLRKNDLGRANFILLDRLPQRDLSVIQTPENVPRLYDLVKSKHDRYRPAFYSVLQNTLVAKDLEQANRIAYGAKRWRVVTLDGQLIDKSGTMSGGGTRVVKGAMSSKVVADVTKDQVVKLEVDRDTLEETFGQFQQRMQQLEARLRQLQDRVPELETQAQKLRLEVESLDRNIADAEKRVEELKSESQPSQSDNKRVAELEKTIRTLEKETEKLQSETAGIEEEIRSLQDKIMEVGEKVEDDIKEQTKNTAGFRKEAEEAQEALESKKEELEALKTELDTQTTILNETRGIEIEMRNKLEENQKIMAENQKQLEPLPMAQYTKDELEDMSKDELKASIALLEESTSQAVELSVLAEYRRRVSEHSSRMSDLNEALTGRDSAKKRLDDLRRMRLEGFMEGFSTISMRLKEMYQMITMGGNAELELVDSLDPFSEGILFSVMPPKKSWKNISNLSGGEKTLSSLALVFALHHYKPTPLYVMDEIDAALDFRNVSIVASYIKERTKNAQFIVISLRNNMFELAARLVGVYKVNHMTKSVTIENKDYIQAAAA